MGISFSLCHLDPKQGCDGSFKGFHMENYTREKMTFTKINGERKRERNMMFPFAT